MTRCFYLCMSLCWLVCISSSAMVPEDHHSDSINVVDIEKVEIISTPKETGMLRSLPAMVSIVSQQDLQRNNVTSIKGLSQMVPNLFIPSYGSRLTSAIYIRGVGSRINSPAVGLYVDNVPYYDKSAFDFSFYDIERVDVLRGPQGTLYGRNSMGGLIRINTRSPLSYQGTDIKLGLASGNLHRHASLTHYHRISEHFAFSAGGYYEGSSGFFKNTYSDKRQDGLETGGGRLRAIMRPNEKLKLDLSVGYDYSHEDGYPYFYLGQLSGEETHRDQIGHISYNENSSYRRGMLNGGLNVEYRTPSFTLNSVTGFQHLEDRMFMDQDFLPDSLFTLTQCQKMSIISQELTIKSSGSNFWEWVNGVTASKQWLRTTGPVVFGADGMIMLENTINSHMPDLSARGISDMGIDLTDNSLKMSGRFNSPVTNAAIFHQSMLHFSNHLTGIIGLRLDYEHNSLRYYYPASLNYDFSVQSARMPLTIRGLKANSAYDGQLSDDNLVVLPKVAIQYNVNKDCSIYLSAAKGHRAGGYNIQMFSDLLQNSLRNAMMQGVKQGAASELDRYAAMGMPQRVIDMIKSGLSLIPDGGDANVEEMVKYKPEYQWTYEVGTKLHLINNTLSINASAFLTTVRNQQIARFATGGFGRMMVNAGRSRNWGFELSTRYHCSERVMLWANYGFTYAIFTNYDSGNGNNYTHNRVPFIPRHTISLGADWAVYKDGNKALKSLTIGSDLVGAGRIYWTELNNASEPFYATLNAHALLDFGTWQLNLWGRNLTNKHYHSFYFESINRAYAQKGSPIQAGFDVNIRF